LVYFLTKQLPREYETGTSIYTGIASGYSITSGSDAARAVDYFAVNNAFDNLIVTLRSRQTIEEVAISLLSQHLLLEMPDPLILSSEGFEKLRNTISEEERAQLIVPGNFQATVEKVTKYKNQSVDNVVIELLNANKGYYSIQTIYSKLTAERKSTSDFVDITYKADDPGVCLNTVKFLTSIFINKYKYLKGSENINVVKWFEARLREASEELNGSENRLKDFGVRNKIINLYEQAKAIAVEKEANETSYYAELMKYEGLKQAVARLEDQIESRDILLKNNQELLRLRKDLAVNTERYERAKIYNNPPDELASLAKKINDLKNEIRLYVLQYYSINNTIESVPQKDLLLKWLNASTDAVESEAKLKIFIDRRKEFDRQYDEISPANMQLSRLEREVGVAEKQYLEILHGLHLAKLRQQNIEFSNNLQVTDSPMFPTKPLPSRRLLLIVLSFLASFFLLAAYFVSRELLDSSIKDPSKAEEITGLKLFSAIPSRLGILNTGSYSKADNMLLDYAVSNLKIELENSSLPANNYLITIISSREGEGKTYAAQRLAEKLYTLDYSVLLVSNDENIEEAETEDKKFRMMRYEITSRLFTAKTEESLLPELSNVRRESYNFIIVEIPAISINALPNQLLKNSRLSLLLLDARRAWTRSDEYILELFKKASTDENKILVWLNFVAVDNLGNLIGHQPKIKKSQTRYALRQANAIIL